MRTLLALVLALLAVLKGATSLQAEEPQLVVVISIDQFRGDYLQRFYEYFGKDGFNRLLKGGANFVDCHHAHSHTKTGPGHAVMLTGVHANVNGIIGNDWLDRSTLERVSCVGDTSVQIIGLPAPTTPPTNNYQDLYLGRSPRNLLAGTVGDELKMAQAGRPKVIGISNKDRAAILMSGRMADAAYFMEEGRMVSSTYYMKALPPWVTAWNAAGKADAFFGKVWDRVLPIEAYAGMDPDDMPGEDATASGLGNTFPKKVTGGDDKPGARFYDAFENTPFSNEVLEDFAETAILSEKLGGRTAITDLLCLSFSANDHIGHLYGPDSQEIMDNVVRMDRTLARFFDFLDRTVGLKRCTIVLTADHGAAPTPEHVHARHPEIPAGRIDGKRLVQACEEALSRAFGPLEKGRSWLLRDDGSFLFRPEVLAAKKVTSAAAQDVVRKALLSLDFVQAAYTRTQLESGAVVDELGRQAVLSFNRERSGDVYFQAKPWYFSREFGSNHGTPYNYDTHVPLVWFGVGVKPGVYTQRVNVADLAPTLAHLLGLNAPPQAEGRVLF